MARTARRTTRRELFSSAVGAAFAAGVVKNGRLKQSVSRWPYATIPLPDFCRAVAEMRLTAVDLLEEAEWPVAREHGLICSMGYAGGGTIRDGLNVLANHDAILRNFERTIPRAAALKVPNVITRQADRHGPAGAGHHVRQYL